MDVRSEDGEASSRQALRPRDAADGDELTCRTHEQDVILHGWCQRQLQRYLSKLLRSPAAQPFLELPEHLCDEYLALVQDPMDLVTVSRHLEAGVYNDPAGLVSPAHFWDDVTLCSSNCLLYFENAEESEEYKMAEALQRETSSLEDEFWASLARVEGAIAGLDPKLGVVATELGLAADQVADGILLACQEGSLVMETAWGTLADWFHRPWQNVATSPREQQLGEESLHFGQGTLRDHFRQKILDECGFDTSEELLDMEHSVKLAVSKAREAFNSDGDTADFVLDFPDHMAPAVPPARARVSLPRARSPSRPSRTSLSSGLPQPRTWRSVSHPNCEVPAAGSMTSWTEPRKLPLGGSASRARSPSIRWRTRSAGAALSREFRTDSWRSVPVNINDVWKMEPCKAGAATGHAPIFYGNLT